MDQRKEALLLLAFLVSLYIGYVLLLKRLLRMLP